MMYALRGAHVILSHTILFKSLPSILSFVFIYYAITIEWVSNLKYELLFRPNLNSFGKLPCKIIHSMQKCEKDIWQGR